MIINVLTIAPLAKSNTPEDQVPQLSQGPQVQGQEVTFPHGSVLVPASGSQAWPPHAASLTTRLRATLWPPPQVMEQEFQVQADH